MLMPRRIVPNISCISGMRVCGEVVRACLLGRAVCFRCHLLPTQAVGSGTEGRLCAGDVSNEQNLQVAGCGVEDLAPPSSVL